ncbi:MAG TPA: hypothetical protein DCZ01_09005 [Elusimicrobia bacterium]|nr:MAG: hypothetical protein A2X37_02465 [Elusimicrobia bacterium GWA2_66_18]OGR76264.1 MAG: hypothetical protein A2X40_11825 [Elusimicrobia bacterium GWC2_65_9]HAZ08641.1 hypothetical protein [Elusimicrobiota bacterium]
MTGQSFCQSYPTPHDTDTPIIVDDEVLRRWDIEPALYDALPDERKKIVEQLVRPLEQIRRGQVAELKSLAGEGWKRYVDEREKPTPEGLQLLNRNAQESTQLKEAKKINLGVVSSIIPDPRASAQDGGAVFDGARAQKAASIIAPAAVVAADISAGAEFLRAQRIGDRTFSWSSKADSAGSKALHTAKIGQTLTAVGGGLAVADGVWNIVSGVMLAHKTHKGNFNERTIIGGVKVGGGTLQLLSLALLAAAPYLLAAGSLLYMGASIYQYRHEIAAFIVKFCKKIKEIFYPKKPENPPPPYVKGMQRRPLGQRQ